MNFRSFAITLTGLLFAGTDGDAAQLPTNFAPHRADLPVPYVTLVHPTWSRDAVIYEINTRQFTNEGTLSAAERELPRLKTLGVDILWLMPLHPVGKKSRLGTFGSPYSVRDYFAVDPALGNMADLKSFVDAAHRQGMHVILDWVANHSAYDNPLVAQHPDWYEHDENGNPRPPLWVDWADVAEFDYSKPELRRYMTEAMKFWVREAGVDGFRADFAGGVPLQFWENARSELDAIKPVFMLAEWEFPDLNRRAFDASYAWILVQAMKDVATGKADTHALADYFNRQEEAWPREAFKLAYTSNHDISISEGSDREIFGPALPGMIALTFVANTVPVIYNGEEVGNEKRLNFLTREPIAIDWHSDASMTDLYTRLIGLKKKNPALYNGQYGGRMIPIQNNASGKVFSFARQKGANKILSIFNFSNTTQDPALEGSLFQGNYIDLYGKKVEMKTKTKLRMAPWDFRILIKRSNSQD